MIDLLTIDRPDEAACARLAELYNLRQYSDRHGRVNPNDPRYVTGGVHFSRNGAWFAEQLARSGAVLLAAQRDREIIGYSMFFTELDAFPPFADDMRWMAGIEGVDRLAYSYLTTVHPDFCLDGVAWQLVSRRRELCAAAGVTAIGTEVFVRPQVNVASIALHHKQVREFGAVDTGRTAIHELEIPAAGGTPARTVRIEYVQFLSPCHDGTKAIVDEESGEPKLVKAA
ncbi:MAG: hypothetical protein KDD66_13530 [Bdellovibrionales bacterium]|nr:hypothetical protein [Bdellovibrionales bacterium]